MENSMWKLYALIKLASVFARQFLLPNPFSGMDNPEILNWIAGFILYPITFGIVKIFYEPRSNPPKGAFLYLFFYSVHTGLIALSSQFNFSKPSIIIISVLYAAIIIGFKSLQSKTSWRFN